MAMKIKLPKAVGKELDLYQKYYNTLDDWESSFDRYVHDAIKNKIDVVHTHEYLDCKLVSDRNQHIVNLLHAWIDGWEEE